jgi:AcrR family transcriptional regulator
LKPAGAQYDLVDATHTSAGLDAKARRRAARREQSRAEILDAAERVFGEDGIKGGSLRRIAELSGYSVGAIYLFFDNKADVLAKTLARRGDEWGAAVLAISKSDATPLKKLHQVVGFASGYFSAHPNFRLLMSRVSRGSVVAGYNLAVPSDDDDTGFSSIMAALRSIVEDGQRRGQIRSGNPRALAHLFSVLVNEYLLLRDTSDKGGLSEAEFHAFVDGAIRADSEG